MDALSFAAARARRHPPNRRPGQAGASLAEITVTLAALATLLGVGVPEVNSWVQATQLRTHGDTLLFDLYRARSEAIKRNTRVALCKSADGETCAGQGGWEQGSIVFQDANNNATREPGEALLHRSGALPADYVVSGNQSVRQYVSYAPTGMTRMESGAFQAGTLTLCRRSAGSTDARQIVINAGGRPRVQATVVASCL